MSLLLFDLPELNRDQLDNCELRLDALENWLKELPFAHPGISSQKLSLFLDEFNQLKFIPLRRLEWLNVLQPAVAKVTQGLDRSSRLHNEGDQAQALQQQMAQGYKRVVNDLLKLRDQLQPPILARSLLQALFTALEHSCAIILRSCLLSVTAPHTSWNELNLLYNLACQSRLQHKNLKETAPQNCEQIYFQTVLLGLIQAETLRKDEINQVYPFLGEWSGLISRLPYDHPNGLFVISTDNHYLPKRTCLPSACLTGADLENDEKPKQPLSASAKSRSLAIDTRMLAETLITNLSDSNISKRLLQHLAACLGEVSNGITPRIEVDQPIQLVLGLRSTHFHMNNRQTLSSLIADNNSNAIPLPEEELDKRYPIHQLTQVNASATGYCFFWPSEATDQLKTGELVAFKEKANEPWQAGLIRWVREVNAGQQLGVERLGGRMQPCAVKSVIKLGEQKEFMHGFLIPEMQVLGIAASLITPLLLFREGQKVEISYNQGLEKARLIELISSPGEFNRFRLESLGPEGLSLH